MKQLSWLLLCGLFIHSTAEARHFTIKACYEKQTISQSALRVVRYCLDGWAEFTQPTDPIPDSCEAKLTAYENAVKNYRACLKSNQDDN